MFKTWYLIPGHESKFRQLCPWEALNDMLTYHRMDVKLRLMKNGSAVPAETYMRYRRDKRNPLLLPAPLGLALSTGATLIIDAVDEIYRPIAALARGLERALCTRVGANLYVSLRTTPGFRAHWDDHDAFALQVVGRKRWRVWAPTEVHPLDRSTHNGAAPPLGPPLWDGELTAGDVLYLPRGWWHAVAPCNEPTLHLNVGLLPVTGLDLIAWVASSLRSRPELRSDIPRFASAEEIADYWARVRRCLTTAIERPDLLSAFLSNLDGAAEPRAAFGLPWTGGLDGTVSTAGAIIISMLPRPLSFDSRSGSGKIEFAFFGMPLSFPAPLRPVLEHLSRVSEVPLSDFLLKWGDSFDRDQMLRILRELARSGLVCVSTRGGTAYSETMPPACGVDSESA